MTLEYTNIHINVTLITGISVCALELCSNIACAIY
jgi:hypothetical protein